MKTIANIINLSVKRSVSAAICILYSVLCQRSGLYSVLCQAERRSVHDKVFARSHVRVYALRTQKARKFTTNI